LHHHRPSDNDIIRQHARQGTGRRQVDVDHTRKTRRDGAPGPGREGREGRAAGDTAGGEGAERRRGGGVGRQVEGRPGSDGRGGGAAGHGQRGERGEDEVAAFRARLDEGRGEREDLLGAEGGVEGLRGRGGLGGDAHEGLVAGLDGQDGGRGAEDALVGDERAAPEVGRDADVLEHGGRGHHAGGVGEAEVVGAGLHGLDARLGDGALEEADVGGLAGADVEEVVNLLLCQAEGLEVGRGELGEALLVKGGFEPF